MKVKFQSAEEFLNDYEAYKKESSTNSCIKENTMSLFFQGMFWVSI